MRNSKMIFVWLDTHLNDEIWTLVKGLAGSWLLDWRLAACLVAWLGLPATLKEDRVSTYIPVLRAGALVYSVSSFPGPGVLGRSRGV